MPARLKSVTKAQKDQGNCSKCSTPLPAGSPYRYYRPGFRSRMKVRVCMKPECTPNASELDGSKLSEAYSAQEEALTAIDASADFSGVQAALDDCVSRVNDLIGEYEDTINEYPMTEGNLQEKVDLLNDWVSEMEGYSPNEVDEVDDTVTDDRDEEEVLADQDEYDQALDDAKEEARDLVNSFSG